ncbi:MAG: hypothetical protein WCV88_05960 [Patescibacteria group bacterium]|jgi:hypothetical protein
MNNIPKPLLFITVGLGLVVLVLIAFMAGQYVQPDDVSPISNANVNTNPTLTNVNSNKNLNTNTTTNTNVNTNKNVTTNEVVRMAATSGVTWLDQPEVLKDLNLLKNSDGYDHYFKVATLTDGGSIIYMYREEMGYAANLFRKNSDASYVLLSQHSQSYIVDAPADYLATSVTIDTETYYPEIDAPDNFTVNGLALSQYSYDARAYTLDTELSADDAAALVEFGQTNLGTVYRLPVDLATTYDNGQIVGKKYLLVLADHSIVSYTDTVDFLNDDNSITAKWNKDNTDFAERTYLNGVIANGCGVLGGNQYVVDLTPEALDVVGVTNNDENLYTVLDSESSLLRNAYESYKIGRDYEGSTVRLLSYDDFVAATPLLVWSDAMGDYILFMDTEYGPNAECGKPVVYLYPTKITDVTVQVGANVTKSEPVYNAGWQVTAEPDGQLTLADGSIYSNLFWEGKGIGEYPQITFGRVVPHNQIGVAIKSDLIKQGLNAQEIKDFMDFWMSRLPNTPYVRLSWFSTAQMNRLAPLQVSPRPDTTIRVFLDFAGQTTPTTTLQPQILTTVPRNGFTLVEWGGLLLGQ